ncbi:MAG: hypothetical protein HQK65_12410 [Desulfamplus sp.]|nr:hypothetical protein [Desulfamplus sp.]
MTCENNSELKIYQKNLKDLYVSVGSWLSEKNISFKEGEHTLNEEKFGQYNVAKMMINLPDKNTKLAELCPVAASVLGADGRVDLICDFDKLIFLYLMPERPDGTIKEVPYKGVEQNAWYWIEDYRRAKAHLIEKELFFELLEVVSDYEF